MSLFKALVLASMIATAPGQACTLWGAAGSASAEGTLLVKNRDWRPDHVQSLRLVRPDDGLVYVGLYADTGGDVGLKGGVNQAGLSVVSASASSLPKAVRQENHEQYGVMAEILRRYRSLDEVDAHAPAIFAQAKPMFLMLADATGLMRVEIGQDGRYGIVRQRNGTLTHTNHYLDTSLLNGGQRIGESSATRLQRINALLAGNAGPHTLDEFYGISQDRQDGPDDSLWRNGKEYTLASWQIALPAEGAPRLVLVIANPGVERRKVDLKLDAAFWSRPAQVLLGP